LVARECRLGTRSKALAATVHPTLPKDDVHATPPPGHRSAPLPGIAEAEPITIADDGTEANNRMHRGIIASAPGASGCSGIALGRRSPRIGCANWIPSAWSARAPNRVRAGTTRRDRRHWNGSIATSVGAAPAHDGAHKNNTGPICGRCLSFNGIPFAPLRSRTKVLRFRRRRHPLRPPVTGAQHTENSIKTVAGRVGCALAWISHWKR
jgi:hypothetical protein